MTTPGGETVQASVGNGRYAAWWPAGEDDASNPEFSDAPVIEATLAYGTVVPVYPPS